MERWKKIDGYDNYSVSTEGRVRNDRTGRVLKPNTDSGGYLQVNLSNGVGKSFMIHRLVAEAFIPNPDNLPQVNHINEDKTDNRASNLEFCTAKYNITYGTHMKRVRENQPHSKRCIIGGVEYISVREAERQLNIPKGSLNDRLYKGYTTYKGHSISYC